MARRRSKRKAQQVLNQVALLATREAQGHASIVMVDNVTQCREPPVVIEPALGVRKQLTNGRGSITVIGCAIGLKAVNANFRGHVEVPAWIGPERFDVAIITLGLTTKQHITP